MRNLQRVILTQNGLIACHNVALSSVTRRTPEMLEHYLAINAGRTPHNEAEITQVKSMIAGA